MKQCIKNSDDVVMQKINNKFCDNSIKMFRLEQR